MEKALKRLEDSKGLSADTKKEIMMQGDEALELYYRRIQEFKQYPGMVKLYVNAAQKFFDSHPQSKMRAYLDNAAEWFVMSLYCNSTADFKERFKSDNLFGEQVDCKAFLEREFNIRF